MRTIETGDDVRPLPLLEALQAADIPVAMVHPDGRIVLDVDDDDDTHDAAVLAVLAAHDTAAIDAAEAAERTQFETDVANLKLYQGIASPTLAQTAGATKAQNRILRRVVAVLRDD